MRVLTIMIAASFLALCLHACSFTHISLAPKTAKNLGIKIWDSIVLSDDAIEGEKFFGASDLHYDAQTNLLYVLNDRGVVYTFSPSIKNHKFKELKPQHAYTLKAHDGKRLGAHDRDSEGMCFDGKHIAISFEGRPRVTLFDKQFRAIKDAKIPKILRDIHHYQGRNSALEALTYRKKDGFITAGEYPLRGKKSSYHDIYSQKGKLCAIKREMYNAIVAMETMPDGDILLLQRKYLWRSLTMETTISRIKTKHIKAGICKVDKLAWMSNKKDWDIDNFEGLTHYHDNLYFMISDDNDNFFQKSILTLFEVL